MNKHNLVEKNVLKNKIVLFLFLGIIWGVVTVVEYAENGSIRTADVVRLVGVGAVLLSAVRAWKQRKAL